MCASVAENGTLRRKVSITGRILKSKNCEEQAAQIHVSVREFALGGEFTLGAEITLHSGHQGVWTILLLDEMIIAQFTIVCHSRGRKMIFLEVQIQN